MSDYGPPLDWLERVRITDARRYTLGVDLAQAQDFTTVAVAERTPWPAGATYAIRHLERLAQGTSYPAIVRHITALMQTGHLRGRCDLVVDATGVGRPVVDSLRAAGLNPVAITIHGGMNVTPGNGGYSVPKRDLVGSAQVLLQSKRLKIAAGLPLVRALEEELLNFQMKIDPRTAHDSYAVWREGLHDDLVLAVSMAVWYGERQAHSVLRVTEY